MKTANWFTRWAAVWEPEKIQMYGYVVKAGEFPPPGYFLRRQSAVKYAGSYANHDNRFGGTPGRWRIIHKGEL